MPPTPIPSILPSTISSTSTVVRKALNSSKQVKPDIVDGVLADDDRGTHKNILNWLGMRFFGKLVMNIRRQPHLLRQITIFLSVVVMIVCLYVIYSSLNGDDEGLNITGETSPVKY